MIKRRHFVFGLPAALALAGQAHAISEMDQERAAQANLPQSKDPIWPKLRACKVAFNESTGLYRLTPTPEVKALANTTVRVTGFVLPLDGLDMTMHFLLGVNTPVCLYHPPGEPNEVMEVKSTRPVRWTSSQATIEGRFELISNTEQGIFFALNNARPA